MPSADDVHRLLSADAIGRGVAITVVRDGRRLDATVVPAEAA